MKTDRRRVHVFRRGVMHLVRGEATARRAATYCGLYLSSGQWCWCRFHWPNTPVVGARDCARCTKAAAA